MSLQNISPSLNGDELVITIPDGSLLAINTTSLRSPVTAVMRYEALGAIFNGEVMRLLVSGKDIASIRYDNSNGVRYAKVDLTPFLTLENNTVRCASCVYNTWGISKAQLTIISGDNTLFIDRVYEIARWSYTYDESWDIGLIRDNK